LVSCSLFGYSDMSRCQRFHVQRQTPCFVVQVASKFQDRHIVIVDELFDNGKTMQTLVCAGYTTTHTTTDARTHTLTRAYVLLHCPVQRYTVLEYATALCSATLYWSMPLHCAALHCTGVCRVPCVCTSSVCLRLYGAGWLETLLNL
jgi:hypothetical protein